MRQMSIDDSNNSSLLGLTMPAVVTATVFGSQRDSLRALGLSIQVLGLEGAEFAALVALRRLRCLQVPLGWAHSAISATWHLAARIFARHDRPCLGQVENREVALPSTSCASESSTLVPRLSRCTEC